MAIKYALYPNHLTDNPDDHMAIVVDQTSRSMEYLIDIMIGRGSTVTKADALSVIEEYEAAIVQALKNGDSINTPLFRINASIPGVFFDRDDRYDPSRHEIRLNLNPGSRLREAIELLSVEKVEPTPPRPVLQVFRDIGSDTINELITPGSVGEISGRRLKMEPEDSDQGVFLIAADGTETRVETVIRNKLSNVIFTIPDRLTGDEYEVELRTKMVNNSNGLRTGRLDTVLATP